MKKLAELTEEIDKCVKCGTCRSVCPIFKIGGREPASTRGRLALVGSYVRGEVGLTEGYVRQVKDCTMCGACTSNCPSRVDTPRIIAAAREDLAEKQGTPAVASMVFKNLKSPGVLMPLAMKCAAIAQGLFLKGIREDSGLLSRFNLPVPGAGEGRLFPPLARKFFMDTREAKERRPGKGEKTGSVTVAFYVGCGVNYLMPDIGRATLDALERAGADVIVPRGQVCCGMPAYATGEASEAKEMAVKNLEEFDRWESDYIVTSCATCGHGLKHTFVELLGSDPEYSARVEAFSKKVRDISEILAELGFTSKAGEAGGDGKRVVTYHDPCHLGRMQGVREEPRDLLKTNPDLRLREMKNPCRCCGLGGGLSISNYELSSEIGRLKAEAVRGSGADVVATGCPGCIVQLRDCLHRLGVDAMVKHVVELL